MAPAEPEPLRETQSEPLRETQLRDAWNPAQYGKFAAARAQPFWDLAALVERDRPIRRAVDLGCGPGELTAALADQLAIAEMTGVDSSPSMLADAAGHDRAGL